MARVILIYGTVAGLIAGGVLSALVIGRFDLASGALGMAIGYLTMLVAFSMIFVAIRRRRDEAGGGVIRFWPAFTLGIGISAVASVIYVLAWEIAQAAAGIDFARDYAAAMVRRAQAAGARGAVLARTVAEAEQFRRDYANPLYRLPASFMEIFPVGLLVSLIAAAMLRNPRVLPMRG